MLERKRPRGAAVTFGVALLLVFACAFLYTLYEAGPSVQSSVIAAMAAVGLAYYSYWTQQTRAQSEAHRPEKVKTYGEFYDIVFKVLRLSSEDGSVKQFLDGLEIKNKQYEIYKNILFYGSPDVLNTYTLWMRSVGDPRTDTMANVAQLLLSMRKDIGLSNRGLDRMSIIAFMTRNETRTDRGMP
jgi:hypothetical protein